MLLPGRIILKEKGIYYFSTVKNILTRLFSVFVTCDSRASERIFQGVRRLIPGGSLHALHYLPIIRYLLYFVIHICYSLLVIHKRYLLFRCVIRSFFVFFSNNTFLCCNESNAITCSVRNRKIHSKRVKSLR